MVLHENKELRYLTRTEDGWWLRFRSNSSRAYQEFFSDSEYGGSASALKAAMRVRNELDTDPHLYGAKRPFGRGITLNYRKHKDKVYYNWVAYWSDPRTGKQRRRSFACQKYGFERAKQLALSWREEMARRRMEEIEGKAGKEKQEKQ